MTAHSEKDQAAGTYKGSFGFHPLVAFLDRDDGHGEALAGVLRPGNAGANSAADNIDGFEQALFNMPAICDAKTVVVRGDSAMATKAFVGHARTAGVKVSISLPIRNHPRIAAAIRRLHDTDDDTVWQPAVAQHGDVRPGAHAAELDSPPLDGWPEAMRVIVRREPLHPGAQQTIDDIDGHRFTATLTDTADRPVEADRFHRARARIETGSKTPKTAGWPTCRAATLTATPSGCTPSSSPSP